MKILKESEVVSLFDKNETIALLRKAGKLKLVDVDDMSDSGQLVYWIFQYQEMKKLGIPKSKILAMFIAANSPDELGEIVYSEYGNTKKYADLYPNDYTIPKNKERQQRVRRR